jgi:hypothetical protein
MVERMNDQQIFETLAAVWFMGIIAFGLAWLRRESERQRRRRN